MKIETHHNDPEAFCKASLPFLMESEVENNLIIGLALRLQSMVSSLQNRQLLFWVIRDEEEVIGAAMCTPPNDVLL